MIRKMKVLWFTLFFLLPNHLVGQYTFEKIISPAGGAYPMAGCLLSNGHYAFPGANFTAGSYGFSLLTINELGDTILTKKFQFGNLQTIPSSIREGQYGHMIISGYLKNPVTPYDRNAIHIITDSLGEAISIKRIQISSDTQGQDAFHTADGGLVMFGNCGPNPFLPLSMNDIYVIKIDSLGSIIWYKWYHHSDYIVIKNVQQIDDGGFIIAGMHQDAGGAVEKNLILKIDSIGNIDWSKKYNNNGEAVKIIQTFDGGFVITGRNNNGTNAQIFLIKTDSQGNPQWQKEYNSLYEDYSQFLHQTKDSGFVIAGRTGN